MPLKVFYLDDEPSLLEMFAEIFESPEISVRTFAQPTEFLEIVKNEKPDLYVLDYRLPRTTGDEVALQLDVNIPKILITGDLVVNPKANFLKIFKKPYQLAEMQDFLDSLIKK